VRDAVAHDLLDAVAHDLDGITVSLLGTTCVR
jgi:hypothetical protein